MRYSVSQARTVSVLAFHPPLDTPVAQGGGFAPHLSVFTRDADGGLHLARQVQGVRLQGVHPMLAARVRSWDATRVEGRMGAWPHVTELGGVTVWAHATGTLFVVNARGLSVPAATLVERDGVLIGPGVALPVAALRAHTQGVSVNRAGAAS